MIWRDRVCCPPRTCRSTRSSRKRGSSSACSVVDSIEFYTWAEGFFQEREELLGRVLAFTLKSVVEVNEDELTASTVLEVELAYSCPALPVGGHRFRPSMEDFLYFTINECGFRAKENWEATLLSTRREWLDTQCRAAVRDSPRSDCRRSETTRLHDHTARDTAGSLPPT